MMRLIAGRELEALRRTGALYALLGVVTLVQGLHGLAFAIDERRTTARALAIYFHHGAYVMEAAGVILALTLVVMGGPAQMLWRTAPIREHQWIGGRALAGVAVLLSASLVSLALPVLIIAQGHGSAGHLFAGAFGDLLTGLLGFSLGLAGTAIFRRPLAGAVAAAGVLAGLELMPMVADRAGAGWREVLAEAAPVWAHNDGFRRGILDLGDGVFLLGLTYAALVVAMAGLRERRWAP